MRRYFLLTLASATIFFALHICIVLFVPAPIKAEYWVRDSLIVKQHLAKQMGGGRIVFLGGSGTLFGVSAKLVSREMGIPALNMGLHAGLRLDRILLAGERVVRPGDTVVLTLEQAYYSCNEEPWTDWQVRNALAWDRSYFQSFPVVERAKAIFSAGVPMLGIEIVATKLGSILAPKMFASRDNALAPAETIWQRYQSGQARSDKFQYSAYNLDRWGDMTHNRGTIYKGKGVPADEPAHICPFVHRELTSFVKRLVARHVRVLVAHPPYLIDGSPSPGWRAAEATFRTDILSTGAVLIDDRQSAFMPRSMFFNTDLHLNEIGRRKWTDHLVLALKEAGVSGNHTELGREDHSASRRSAR